MRIFLAIVCVMTLAPACQAQSLFGSSGALSSTSSASAGSLGTSGSSGFGSTGTSSMSGNSSAFGGGTGAGTGRGAGSGSQSGNLSTLGQSQLNAADGSLGATIGQSGFVGRGDTTGRFVGNQNASTQRMQGSSQRISQLQSVVGNDEFNPSTNSATTQKLLARPVMRLGFSHPQIAPAAMQSSIQTRLSMLPQLGPRAAGVTAHADENGQVTLSGSVTTEDDRKLMETLVRLEPGVRSVRNDLTVADR